MPYVISDTEDLKTLLYVAAEKFDFIVDVRGSYPTAIKGMRAAQICDKQDLIDFLDGLQEVE